MHMNCCMLDSGSWGSRLGGILVVVHEVERRGLYAKLYTKSNACLGVHDVDHKIDHDGVVHEIELEGVQELVHEVVVHEVEHEVEVVEVLVLKVVES